MSVDLTRLDLTDAEPLKDAEAALRRAELADDAALLAWAQTWARPAVAALQALQDRVESFDGDWDEED